MSDTKEVIDIQLNDDSDMKINFNELPSSNLGVGAELLMNEKKMSKGSDDISKEINISELNELEDELNNLSDSIGDTKFTKNDVFSASPQPNVSFNINSNDEDRPSTFDNVGKSTSNVEKDKPTWDGYSKFNDIPVNPEAKAKKQPELSKEELLREKFKFLRKLEDLENKGVQLTKKYTMESPLAEMQGEYENIMNEKQRSNSIKFQGKMLMACITGLEFLNNKFDPFDLKLDGWAEQVNEGIEDYDEIFGELHEKYKSKAKMAPEIKLLFQLGGGAMMLHMSNTMFKSAMPGMDDIMRQNPELMQQFTQAAVSSMNEEKPGFSNFMNDVMEERSGPEKVNPFKQSTPLDNNQKSRSSAPEPPERSMKNDLRPEMKGPSDISDILGGIKTKTVNIKNPDIDQGSTVSLSELKEMNQSLRDSSMPKKSGRKKKSDKNTVSLSF
tara:strand:- start:4939 stop:6264 length:1326 start_codon:yes stop_codon:yes gene_type:complete